MDNKEFNCEVLYNSQGEVDMKEVEEMFEVAEGIKERRMDMERADYPGTGANNHHDLKTPKRA